ncbi:MAG: hypothetical protein EAZ37_01715, partial [Burkholderiales bacterium]
MNDQIKKQTTDAEFSVNAYVGESGFADIVTSAIEAFAVCADAPSLENAKAKYLGKTGAITELLKGMAALSPDEKKTRGAEINRVKSSVEGALNARRDALA